MRRRDAVVIEKADGNYSAYVPDLPGCVVTGDSVAAVEAEIREAIRFHIDGLKQDGQPVPSPTSLAEYVDLTKALPPSGARNAPASAAFTSRMPGDNRP